jgi:hypothetical protein
MTAPLRDVYTTAAGGSSHIALRERLRVATALSTPDTLTPEHAAV